MLRAAIALLACFLVLAVPRPAASQSTVVMEVLDRYLGGDYDVAVRQAFGEDRATFITAYGRTVRDWVNAAGTGETTRRRLAAATFALEFAYSAKAPDDQFWTPGWWYSKVLVEHACRLLRDAPDVHPAETAWFLASIALAKAAGDQSFLAGTPPRVTGPDRDIGIRDGPTEYRSGLQYPSGGIMTEQERHMQFAERSGMALVDHVSDALGRVDDPRIRLAGATDTFFPSVFVRGLMQGFAAPRDPRVADAVKRLTPLRQFPLVRGEVDLDLGFAAFIQLRGAEAAALLSAVPAETDDPTIVYLSSFFLGLIMEMNDRRDEAIAAYRHAASWRPYSSVALPLAALLFAAGARDEAVALTNASIVIDRPGDDPLLQFGQGDLRLWPVYRAELRAAFSEGGV